MKRVVSLLVFAGVVTACQADSPSAPIDAGPQLNATSAGLTAQEQAIVDELTAGADAGAILDRDIGCGILTGFSNNGIPVGFGGLFPVEGPQGICPLSSFARTNPDGTVDVYLQGSGAFFLVLFGAGVYPSTGSEVRWRAIDLDGGIRLLTITGTLSNGSRVRAQFVTTPDGTNVSANTLWVEGVGYVVGGPGN